MTETGADFWTDDTSVLFTSFWGWRPETWGTVGWSRKEGRTHRDKLLKKLSDPFITAIYVTRDPMGFDRDLVGKIAGFYLMSNETGDRDQFTHPIHHSRFPDKWRHSLRALRAFSYISDPLLQAKVIEPSLSTGAAQAVASWGKVLDDPAQIRRLRQTPWMEVPVFRPGVPIEVVEDPLPADGFVPAGPAATRPFVVSPQAAAMGRRLYVLRLEGDTDAYLGKSAQGRHIYKIGLSSSPDARRRGFQKAMPRGAFRWRTERTSPGGSGGSAYDFDAAVTGEDAMKRYLAGCCEYLGGEFYLASEQDIELAWQRGIVAADRIRENGLNNE